MFPIGPLSASARLKSASETSGIFDEESKSISSVLSSISRKSDMNSSHFLAPDGAALCGLLALEGSKRCEIVMRRFAADERG